MNMDATVNQTGQDRRQYITFLATGQEFGADIMMIREIRGWTETTALPHVPAYVRGVINLRGMVLPVIDLKARLGLGMTAATAKHVIIVVNAGDRTVGLLVDAVSDILTVSTSEIQAVPDMVHENQNEYVDGIAVLDGRMVTLLSMTKLAASLGADKGLDQAA
ncbi:MAG: purine-binding chemotaxis protein CheW [Alphaproteobacteria bacterium]|nr:purine-binding chemotaxis protein CheW [Alphaproteobacteria bacterium]